ncbi:MAG: sensor histidine kinase [Fermentimonas sp.]|nr:sensor histidine kinase [Fermentimonas sp.]
MLLLSLLLMFARHNINRHKIERLKKEKQLVATQSILDGETAERTRLARDLHDGLGGMLSAVRFNLSGLKDGNTGATIESTDVEIFNKALNTLDESIRELRRVAHNMMPDSLAKYGLKASLTDFCNSISIVKFNYFGSGDRLDSKLEVMIYRTVHELINNSLKHSGAKEIIVQIIQEVDRIAITVQDDGRGFDTSATYEGSGLNNIKDRVGTYNGRMEIWSKENEGTEISVEFILSE